MITIRCQHPSLFSLFTACPYPFIQYDNHKVSTSESLLAVHGVSLSIHPYDNHKVSTSESLLAVHGVSLSIDPV
ncbi:hypothetical protein RRG08_031400 [Elysia crispata]|uniref:Uncharacterized protein n=1 Tax=Elysia crispata TaxID=231223 RepID=A0AAE0ZP30_9GAST|nr:hypothetical protein RRG08_031400 [Elysia crispata]